MRSSDNVTFRIFTFPSTVYSKPILYLKKNLSSIAKSQQETMIPVKHLTPFRLGGGAWMDGGAVAVALRRHREEFLAAEGACLELVALPTKGGEKSAGSVFKCHTI